MQITATLTTFQHTRNCLLLSCRYWNSYSKASPKMLFITMNLKHGKSEGEGCILHSSKADETHFPAVTPWWWSVIKNMEWVMFCQRNGHELPISPSCWLTWWLESGSVVLLVHPVYTWVGLHANGGNTPTLPPQTTRTINVSVRRPGFKIPYQPGQVRLTLPPSSSLDAVCMHVCPMIGWSAGVMPFSPRRHKSRPNAILHITLGTRGTSRVCWWYFGSDLLVHSRADIAQGQLKKRKEKSRFLNGQLVVTLSWFQ